MATETPPVGVCTRCGDITYALDRINGSCGRQPGGKRCKGIYGSALNNDDWAKCDVCDGAGTVSGATCPTCQRTGWSYIRDNPTGHPHVKR